MNKHWNPMLAGSSLKGIRFFLDLGQMLLFFCYISIVILMNSLKDQFVLS